MVRGHDRASRTCASSARVTGADIVAFQQLVRRVPVADEVVRYAVALARTSRPVGEPSAPEFVKKWVEYGASVRAAQYLILGGKARALMQGRYHVSFEDVRALAHPVLPPPHPDATSTPSPSASPRRRIVDELLGRGARCRARGCSRRDRARGSQPRRRPSRFLDPQVLARIGNLELLARTVVEGFLNGLHRSPYLGRSHRLRRAPRLHARRRHPPHRLAAVRAHRPLLREGVRGRLQHRTSCSLLDVSRSMRFTPAAVDQARLRALPGRLPRLPRRAGSATASASSPSTRTSWTSCRPSAKHLTDRAAHARPRWPGAGPAAGRAGRPPLRKAARGLPPARASWC